MRGLCCRWLPFCAAAVIGVFVSSPSAARAGGLDRGLSGGNSIRLEGAAAGAQDEIEIPAPGEPADVEVGVSITSGCVILDGAWLERPYVVSRRGGQVFLNGLEMERDNIFPELGGRVSRGPRSGQSLEDSARSLQVRIESLLLNAGVMIRFGDGAFGAFRDNQAYLVLAALMSDDDPQAKLRVLVDQGFDRFTSAQWLSVIERFRPSDGLRESLRAYEEIYGATEWEAATPQSHGSASTYLMTLIGMSLAVFSFGVVLNHRPQPTGRWRDINASIDGARLVVYCVALIALLSTFDLACTYLADRAGGFWETNPLAAALLASPLYLVAFKVGFTTVSAVILLQGRRYHGMQVASWWLCLAMTLLTVRWVAFHSLVVG